MSVENGLLGVTVLEVDPPAAPASAAPDIYDKLVAFELEEWIRASAPVARDFCKTMITLSLAAIPVVFTVFKFLGQDTAKHPWVAVGGVLTGLVLLASGVLFAAALNPAYATVSPQDFPVWRTQRLARMNQVIRAGSITLVAGVLSAIGLFAALLVA